MAKKAQETIFVLAGTNGGGKSSIGGAAIRAAGKEYFNPDEVAKALRDGSPTMTAGEANSLAWTINRDALATAIAERTGYAFETTLRGRTITALLLEACGTPGLQVRIWYVGLDSAEHHIGRVASRVKKGGHDIPEEKIREAYATGMMNLTRLLGAVDEAQVYDNSVDADPAGELVPSPRLVLHLQGDHLVYPSNPSELRQTPEWAKPLLAAALRRDGTLVHRMYAASDVSPSPSP